MRLTDLNQISEWTLDRTFQPGQTVFLEGDLPKMVYQVVRGIVKLTRVSSGGREIIVGLACEGDFLDIVSILDGRAHGVSASALLGCEVQLVSVSREMAMHCPALVQRLERTSLQELRYQRDWTVAMALERVETRALSALSMLARRLGEPDGKGQRMQLFLNRQEFAELIGSTTETAIRVLSQFRRDGVVQERDGWMTLCAA